MVMRKRSVSVFWLRNEDEDLLLEIEQSYGARLSFRADPIYHVENFKIIDIGNGQEQR